MKSQKRHAKLSATPRRPSQLYPISEEMRHWSALFEAELLTWPGVLSKPMFGFRGIYRGKRIFAALPRSRGFGPTASIFLKIKIMPPDLLPRAESDARIHSNTPGNGWFSFELGSDADV